MTDQDILEMAGVEGGEIFDKGAIIFVKTETKVIEVQALPSCHHSYEVDDCPDCETHSQEMEKARRRFYN